MTRSRRNRIVFIAAALALAGCVGDPTAAIESRETHRAASAHLGALAGAPDGSSDDTPVAHRAHGESSRAEPSIESRDEPGAGSSDRDWATGSTTEWHRVEIDGQPAGSMRIETRERDGGGWIVTMDSHLAMLRNGTRLEVQESQETEEDAEGRIVGFRLEQRLSSQTAVTTGRRVADALEVSTSVGDGTPRATTIPIDPDTRGPAHILQRARRRLQSPGDRISVPTFLPNLLLASPQVLLLGDLEDVETPAGTRKLRRLLVRYERATQVGLVTWWVDDAFRRVKTSTQGQGMTWTTHRTTEEDARSASESTGGGGNAAPEVFVRTAIPVDTAVPPGASAASYRLSRTLPDGEPPPSETIEVPNGAGQLVTRESEHAWRVEIRRHLPDVSSLPPYDADVAYSADGAGGVLDTDVARALEPGAWIQSDDEDIARRARAIVAAAEAAARPGDRPLTSWDVARSLAGWVHANVREKDLRTAFASAAEVYESRAGDCTEHAVLLAALARAAGIPARVACGLVYHQGAFVGHMWTEVHCGEWYRLDATREDGLAGVDRILLARSDLSDRGLTELFLSLAPVLGQVDVDVLTLRPERL